MTEKAKECANPARKGGVLRIWQRQAYNQIMLKFLIKFVLVIIVVLAIGAFAGLTYFGLTPLSKLLGTGQKDLGIKVTQAETKAADEKIGTEIVALPAGTTDDKGFRLEGSKPASFSMTSQEISAHSNNRQWKNYPVRNVQIKIHDDGTIESSAILIISKAMPYALGLGYSQAQIQEAMAKYNIPPVEVPIYILGKGSVANDKVSVDASVVKIGGVTVPGNIVGQANGEAESVLNDLISKNKQSFHCESLTFSNGKMDFKGNVAEKQYVVTQ